VVEAISARSLARSLAHLGVIIRERFADAFHDVAKGLVFGRVILEKRKEIGFFQLQGGGHRTVAPFSFGKLQNFVPVVLDLFVNFAGN